MYDINKGPLENVGQKEGVSKGVYGILLTILFSVFLVIRKEAGSIIPPFGKTVNRFDYFSTTLLAFTALGFLSLVTGL